MRVHCIKPLGYCEVAFTLSEMDSHWRFCTWKCSDLHLIYISFCAENRLQDQRMEAERIQNSRLDQVNKNGGVEK